MSNTVRLVTRRDTREKRREARRRILQATALGTPVDSADIAAMRGLTIREREDSILSDAWILIALIILFIGLVNDRNPALLALGLLMLLVLGVGKLWKNFALTGIRYRRTFDRTHVFPGEPVTMTMTVSNNKRLPLTWLRIQDTLPYPPDLANVLIRSGSDASDTYLLTNSYSMPPFGEVIRSVRLRFPARGFYRVGPVLEQSGDLFTLYRIEREYAYYDHIIVYPVVQPLQALGLPAKEPFGDLSIRRSLFTDPIKTRGIRDYQTHDRFRDVHWKASARRGELQTKVYDPSTGMTLAIFLNVATMPKHWMGFFPELMESAVSVAASLANYGAEQGWGIGFYANGAFPGSDQSIRVPPGRSVDQLSHVLEALAVVTEFATSSIDIMLLRESPRLPWAATMVLVTAVITEEIMVALLRLQEAGRRVVLISLASDAPPAELDLIHTYHIPPDRFRPSPPAGSSNGNGSEPVTPITLTDLS